MVCEKNTTGTYLQNLVELSFEFKVWFRFEDDLLQGFLEGLDSSLSILTKLRNSLVLPLATEALLLRLIHLINTENLTESI